MSDNQAIKTEPLEEPEYEQMLNQKDALLEELRKRVATLETQCVQMKEERGVWRHRALRSESKAEEVNKEYVRVVQTLYGENEKLLEEVHHTNNIREELVRELDLKDAAINRLSKRNKTLQKSDMRKREQIKRLHQTLARRARTNGNV